MTTPPVPPKFQIKDLQEGRANSITGACELDLVHPDGVITMKFDAEMMARLLNVVIRLQRMPVPVAGQTMQLRAFPIDWWTLGLTPDNREVVQTFELKDGGHIGFSMGLDQAERLAESFRETLDVAAKAQN